MAAVRLHALYLAVVQNPSDIGRRVELYCTSGAHSASEVEQKSAESGSTSFPSLIGGEQSR
ncbi:hypothetical protein FHY25_001518 [Xanthomonas arboricola]|nr:hypothetical protein [Xanthomonas campestris]MCW2006937.1 hypothetical protein [Xanthomonas campestris]